MHSEDYIHGIMSLRPEVAGILDALVKTRYGRIFIKHKHTHTESTYNGLVV